MEIKKSWKANRNIWKEGAKKGRRERVAAIQEIMYESGTAMGSLLAVAHSTLTGTNGGSMTAGSVELKGKEIWNHSKIDNLTNPLLTTVITS